MASEDSATRLEIAGHADGGSPAAGESTAVLDFAVLPFELSIASKAEGRMQLSKWGLSQRLTCARFRLRERFDPEPAAAHAFLLDFFNSKATRSHFAPFTAATQPKSAPLTGLVTRVAFQRLSTTVTDMAWFGRFAAADVVTAEIGTGRVRAQMEEVYDGATIGDSFREALANADSEHADLYSPDERCELVFRVLRLVAVGGAMMQWEDEIGPYLDATRSIYRDLVTVVRAPSGAIEVASHAFEVSALEGVSTPLFPSSSPHHACWVVVDPVKAQVTLLYHAWVPFW